LDNNTKDKKSYCNNDPSGLPFLWVRADRQDRPATENLVPGNTVYDEKLLIRKRTEYRVWNPFRSKLAAALMNGLEIFPFKNACRVLYLGVSTGTTASHISDIAGPSGVVFCVEHTSRVAREFLDRVATYRSNTIPILQDARNPAEYFAVFGKMNVVYVDIAQSDQTKIAIDNCRMFLGRDGILFLVIKTRSINTVKDPRTVVRQETDKLAEEFEILQSINLAPYDKDHEMVIAKFLR